MPEYPIRDSILTSLSAQEPWPDNVKLFQPYEVEQILLPDNASCLAVQAFLKMCNLPFEVEMRWNAEFMSPSGRVPFIKCGAFVVSELEPIAQFAANKGVTLCGQLSTEEKAEMRAYMSLITNVLVNAELYISWLDNDTFNQVTKVRNSSVYPWPLGWLQTRAKRNNVAKRLKALHWHDKTLDQVLADVEQCCNSLSQRLGDKDYFFGTPTPLDALLYGHLRALLSARGPKAALMIKPISIVLLHLVARIANLLDMRLTPQEDYLLHEALGPRSTCRSMRSHRTRSHRSRLTALTETDDLFEKPFSMKGVVVKTTEEGNIICKYIEGSKFNIDRKDIFMVLDIIEDIFDKVEEVIYQKLEKKFINKNDFEVINFFNNAENISREEDDLYVENDDELTVDSISQVDEDEDMIKICATHEETDDNLSKETNDKILELESDNTSMPDTVSQSDIDQPDKTIVEEGTVVGSDSPSPSITVIGSHTLTDAVPSPTDDVPSPTDEFHTPEEAVSSNKAFNVRQGPLSTISSQSDEKTSKTSLDSEESKYVMRMPSNEEISVESVLKFLRKRNATYHRSNSITPEVVDVD